MAATSLPPLRVLVAGGGVAGMEALLALRDLAGDRTERTLLTPEAADHSTNVSPDGRFFVDTYSLSDVPPVTVVRSADNGRVIRELERTDISTSTALGWKPVEGRGGTERRAPMGERSRKRANRSMV